MAYSDYLALRDNDANLPKDGERLVFGVHRLAFADRECPAWPKNPAARSNTRYRAWLNRAKTDTGYLLALARKQVARAEEAARAVDVEIDARLAVVAA